MTELYKKYRPTTLAGVVGQRQVTDAIENALDKGEMKHATIFAGPSGTGKTTVARILRELLNCGESDFNELNCAEVRGIDTIRGIAQRMHMAPLGGGSRIWLIDEAHQLTTDAQHAFLKMLEDTPKHVYFILATTHPQKLIPTIKTRCTQYTFNPVKPPDLIKLMAQVLNGEGYKPSPELKELVTKIADNADGGPRKALVLLEAALDCEGHAERMASVSIATAELEGIHLAQALTKKQSWAKVASILKDIDPALRTNAEGVRHQVLGYMASVMLGGGDNCEHAGRVAKNFVDNVYDSGRNGLVYRCFLTVKQYENANNS